MCIKLVPSEFYQKKINVSLFTFQVVKNGFWNVAITFLLAQSKQFTFSLSILLSTKRNNTLIRRGILGRKNTLNIDFVTGIQIKRASNSSYCQSKGFKSTSNKLTRYNGSIHSLTPITPTKMSSPANAAISFCGFWLLIFIIPLHQYDREDAIWGLCSQWLIFLELMQFFYEWWTRMGVSIKINKDLRIMWRNLHIGTGGVTSMLRK